MNTDTRSRLGLALRAAGLTATQVGRAILGETSAQTAYRAGARILDGEHTTDVDRLGELARATGLTIAIGPAGVTVSAVDPSRSTSSQ